MLVFKYVVIWNIFYPDHLHPLPIVTQHQHGVGSWEAWMGTRLLAKHRWGWGRYGWQWVREQRSRWRSVRSRRTTLRRCLLCSEGHQVSREESSGGYLRMSCYTDKAWFRFRGKARFRENLDLEDKNMYSLVLNTSHGVFLKNWDRANFCMVITLLPSKIFW